VVGYLRIARVAEGLGVAWDTANDAVLAEGWVTSTVGVAPGWGCSPSTGAWPGVPCRSWFAGCCHPGRMTPDDRG
jgi:hypothetical protein